MHRQQQRVEECYRDRMHACFIAQAEATGRLLGTATLSMVTPLEPVEKLPEAAWKVHPCAGAAWAVISDVAVVPGAEEIGRVLLAQCERLGRSVYLCA